MSILIATFLLGVSLLCSGSSLEERIVNGTDANPAEYPYVVSYRYNNKHSCGGSIIGNKWILTAAHCIFSKHDDVSSILFGTIYVQQGKRPLRNVRNVVRSIRHPHYQAYGGYENDIGLLELDKPLKFDKFTQPVILPKRALPTPAGSKATLVGWGISKTDGEVMDTLQKVNILVYSDKACTKAYEGVTNSSVHVCAGVPEGGKGQCSGDSGGPLTVNGVQVGVVSWSTKPCTLKGYPGVFSKVSSYIDWICEITGIEKMSKV